MIKSNSNDYNHVLMGNYFGKKILDYRYKTRTVKNSDELKHIPQMFNGKLCFISYDSFQQKYLHTALKIRKFVKQSLNTKEIIAIGGESYLYGDINSYVYTNSKSIFDDAKFSLYKNIKLIDYNVDSICNTKQDIVINLSRLNKNLLININQLHSNKLIIINCHHDDFWKKIKLLTNFKIIKRKQFINDKLKYFITVTILVRKSIVSLGGNCAVAYKLKQNNLRDLTYPFDWCTIKITKLDEILKNNFAQYNKVVIDRYSPNHNSYLARNKYMKFAHQIFNDNFENKLNNYLNAFLKLKNPVFIRLEVNKQSANYDKYLESIFCNLEKYFDDFKFLLISKTKPLYTNKKLKWYRLEKYCDDWRYPNCDICEFL